MIAAIENLPIAHIEDPEYGPAMLALTELQRGFVIACIEHPTWTPAQCSIAAGYSPGPPGSKYPNIIGHKNVHDPRVQAGMDEEAARRMRYGGVIGVAGVVKIALNEQHKDHLKACLALMNRTGRHEMTEHKVTVDDKRPQTKEELIEAIRRVAGEAGLDADAVKKLTGENDVVDADFTVVTPLDDEIQKQMEDM